MSLRPYEAWVVFVSAIPALRRLALAVKRADVLCSLLRARAHGSTLDDVPHRVRARAQEQARAWTGCGCPRCALAIGASRPLSLVDASELCPQGRAGWIRIADDVAWLLARGGAP